MNKQRIQTFAWGAAVGAIVLSIIMFSTGWAVTSSQAAVSARSMSNTAVVDSLTEICIAQFTADVSEKGNKNEKLKRLADTESWMRRDYVAEQGWATMPGSKKPDSQVAGACATRLVDMKAKS